MSEDFDPEFASIYEYASEYHRLGLTPVPCKYPRGRDDEKDWKHPYVAWKKEQYAQITEKKLNEWFGDHKARNIGLLTGAASNGVFIVDIDFYKDTTGEAAGWWQESLDMQEMAGELEDTWTALSGSGGKHFYYKMPDGWRAPQVSTDQNVDFRGQGGFIIVPPSVNHLGQSYKWTEGHSPWDCDLAVAPMWFCKRIDDYMSVCLKNKPKIKIDRSNSGAVGDSHQDPFTGEITYTDGRERNCYKWSWACAMDLRIKYLEGGYPSDEEIKETFIRSYDLYISKNLPKAEEKAAYPNLTDEEIMETVGRGLTAYSIRFNNALAKWGAELLEAAKHPNKKEERKNDSPFDQPPPNAQKDNMDEKINVAEPEKPQKKLLKLYTLDEVDSFVPPKAIIQDVIAENTLGFIYGPPGCGKTFVALSIGLSVAYGFKEWIWGKKIEKTGPVIYISLEGRGDIKNRTLAWRKHHGVQSNNFFRLILDPVNFMNEDSIRQFVAAVDDFVADHPNPALVIIDTVSRAIAGGDENDQKDMSKFVEICDNVKSRYSTSVIGVHHSGRSGTNMRGSTVLDGGADFMLRIERDKENENMDGKIHAEKIKAYPDGWCRPFTLTKIDLDAFGAVTSLVVTHQEETRASEAPKPSHDFGGKQETATEPDMNKCLQMVAAIDEAFRGGYAWSRDKKSRDTNRYAPDKLSDMFNLPVEMCEKYVNMWHRNDVIITDVWGDRRDKKGLRRGKGL